MARLTRTERLSRQGLAHIEVDGVLARLTKKQSADPAAFLMAVQAVALATPMAIRIRERVRDERRPATGSLPPYGLASVALSRVYAERAGLASRWWRSSEEMHAALPARGYHVTGGMWSGLQVRGLRQDSAVIDFAGSSIGRGETKIARGRGGKPTMHVKPRNVRNSQKAGGILKHHKIHVLEPTQDELDAVGAALLERVANGALTAIDVAPHSVTVDAGDRRLADMVRAALLRGGSTDGLQ